MKRFMSKLGTLLLGLSLFWSSSIFAQQDRLVDESVRDITTVMAIGAGGAVLGLSTLSFVDEPKDHLRNILVGGAVGIIIGVGVVAYKQANVSKDDFRSEFQQNEDNHFSTYARNEWHGQESEDYTTDFSEPSLTYSFNF